MCLVTVTRLLALSKALSKHLVSKGIHKPIMCPPTSMFLQILTHLVGRAFSLLQLDIPSSLSESIQTFILGPR